jgi:hypothetical protein
LHQVGHRLQAITDDINRILSDPSAPESTETAPRAQLIAAVDFPPSNYVLSVLLPPVMVVALLGPEAWESTGLHGIEEIVVASVASAVVLALAFVLQVGIRAVPERMRLIALRVGFVFAGLAASAAALVTGFAIGGPQDGTFVYLLPVAVAISAAMVMGALGIAAANRELAGALEGVNLDHERLRRSTGDRNLRATAQVASLLHGPVIGRLSACVMAINFRPGELREPSDLGNSQIADRILSHLEAAAIDLELLSRG